MKNKYNIFFETVKYIILLFGSAVMLYPLVWLVGASFKENSEIFNSMVPFTAHPVIDGYIKAFNDYGGKINIFGALKNTFVYVFPKVIFTVFSCTVTAYGFTRFDFKCKKILFAILMSTLFMPKTVIMIPQFIMFKNINWIDSSLYLPLTVPSAFAADTYFVFLMIQFFRSIPRTFDDASEIDGCSKIQTLVYILCPLMKPAIVSCAVFQFIWSSNDFMGPLFYVSSPEKYPVSVFIKLSMDADSGFEWNRIFALSFISLIPVLVVFFVAQKSFTEGIKTGGLKE